MSPRKRRNPMRSPDDTIARRDYGTSKKEAKLVYKRAFAKGDPVAAGMRFHTPEDRMRDLDKRFPTPRWRALGIGHAPDPTHGEARIQTHPSFWSNPSLTYGQLPTRLQFRQAFERAVPDGVYGIRAGAGAASDPFNLAGDYTHSELWGTVKKLVEKWEDYDEEAGEWASSILGTLGIEWV
jgi:hypothetical protein